MGAQGNTTVDFGAFPGSSHTTTAVTGQAGILGTSAVEAWIRAEASADHSSDEHVVETIQVRASDIVAGVGFTIHAWNTSELSEPVVDGFGAGGDPGPQRGGGGRKDRQTHPRGGGRGTLLYGVWNVSWVWN